MLQPRYCLRARHLFIPPPRSIGVPLKPVASGIFEITDDIRERAWVHGHIRDERSQLLMLDRIVGESRRQTVWHCGGIGIFGRSLVVCQAVWEG